MKSFCLRLVLAKLTVASVLVAGLAVASAQDGYSIHCESTAQELDRLCGDGAGQALLDQDPDASRCAEIDTEIENLKKDISLYDEQERNDHIRAYCSGETPPPGESPQEPSLQESGEVDDEEEPYE